MAIVPLLSEQLEISCIHCTLDRRFLSGEGPILQAADCILYDNYFGRIEVAHIADFETRQELARRVARSGSNLTFLAQPTVFGLRLDPGSDEPGERQRALSVLTACLDEASELGADMMTYCSGPNREVQAHRETALLERYAEFIERLDREAQARSIRLLLEPFDERLDKKRFIGTARRTRRLMKLLKLPPGRTPLMLDLSHIPLLDDHIEQSVALLAPYLGHVHIGNCVTAVDDARFGDSHPYFGYPGGHHAAPEVARFLIALAEGGYIKRGRTSTLGIEIIPAGDERVEEVLAGAKRTLKEAWRLASAAEWGGAKG